MNLGRFLKIFKKNKFIVIENENRKVLFKGFLWLLDSVYLKSCLVIDVYNDDVNITHIVIIDY